MVLKWKNGWVMMILLRIYCKILSFLEGNWFFIVFFNRIVVCGAQNVALGAKYRLFNGLKSNFSVFLLRFYMKIARV